MKAILRKTPYRFWSIGFALAGLCLVFTFHSNLHGQNDQTTQGQNATQGQSATQGRGAADPEFRRRGNRPEVAAVPSGFFDPHLNTHLLPPGGPAPRTEDGHVDLTGRYYPNGTGRMVGQYTPGGVDADADNLYDPRKTPQVNPVFRPETKSKYQYPTPYGTCAPGGTPTSITTQATEHGPVQLVSMPGALWVLTEFPQAIRWIPTDGRKHSEKPEVSFAGESVGHWEGDTLVVDTVAIDTRMRNISVGISGDAAAWTHSDQEHVIERFSRPSKNFLNYQVTVEDPVVLTQPFQSVVLRWSLAQGKDDNWTEYLCTANEDADAWQKVDPKIREKYEKGGDDAPGNPRGR
jgi:hypothetical protein